MSGSGPILEFPKKHPKILIVFCSRSGHTRLLAHQLARHLMADVEELQPIRRPGVFGSVQSAFESLLNLDRRLKPMQNDPFLYDIVLIGSPASRWSLAAPIRTFLAHRASRIHDVAFFATSDRGDCEHVFWQMSRLTETRPMATMAMPSWILETGGCSKLMKAFLGRLMQTWSMQTLLDPTPDLLFRRL